MGTTSEDGYFDEGVAEHYDETSAERFDPRELDPTVDFLAELARGRRVLEFAIGTGRVAVPLAARGLDVHGIDMSRSMVTRLRGKPGGAGIPVTIGDFSTARAEGVFGVVYLVFNTIDNLTSQSAQVACFRNAAAHLDPGGAFVVEVSVPRLRRLPPGERFVVFSWTEEHQGIDEFDVANQGLISHHIRTHDGRTRMTSMPFRYAWPAELDLMAELAGLRLAERWEDWHRTPFTSESERHVSVWVKPT
jgi:SAM-dependent methyltransferase